MKTAAKKRWETISKKRNEARTRRGLLYVPNSDLDVYHRKLAEVRNELSEPAAPVMPLDLPAAGDCEQELLALQELQFLAGASQGRPCAEHREKIESAGFVSHQWFALVHTPIPLSEAKRIPEARDALEEEWRKLEKKNAWLLETVAEYKEVAEEAQAKGITVHFGHLMALVHEKHSEI